MKRPAHMMGINLNFHYAALVVRVHIYERKGGGVTNPGEWAEKEKKHEHRQQ